MENLFVYGTLCFPEIIEKLTGKSFNSAKAVLKGYRRFRVKGADYPAIIVDDQSEVEGLIIENVDKNAMKIISFYESADYRIEKLIVSHNDKISEAYVFVWNADFNDLDSVDWNSENFINNSLSIYLDKVIPETIKAFNQYLY